MNFRRDVKQSDRIAATDQRRKTTASKTTSLVMTMVLAIVKGPLKPGSPSRWLTAAAGRLRRGQHGIRRHASIG